MDNTVINMRKLPKLSVSKLWLMAIAKIAKENSPTWHSATADFIDSLLSDFILISKYIITAFISITKANTPSTQCKLLRKYRTSILVPIAKKKAPNNKSLYEAMSDSTFI